MSLQCCRHISLLRIARKVLHKCLPKQQQKMRGKSNLQSLLVWPTTLSAECQPDERRSEQHSQTTDAQCPAPPGCRDSPTTTMTTPFSRNHQHENSARSAHRLCYWWLTRFKQVVS